MKSSTKQILKNIGVNVCRFILAATFLFSGFVKANDPLGTVYKLEDYLAAWGITGIPELFVLLVALALAFFEFGLGIYLLFGMRRKRTSRVAFAFMAVMTVLTIYIYFVNPVTDCGCFGDAIILTNGQTLLKNIFLLAAAFVLLKWHEYERHLVKSSIYWIVSTISILAIMAYAVYCIYALPVIDFRPYKVGTDIRKMLEVPEEQRPQFKVTIVYEKDGKTLELDIDDDDPDSTWHYVETKREMIKSADHNMMADFYIQEDDFEITEDILATDGYLFFLVAPILQTADEGGMDKYNDLYDYTQQNDMEFYCLTASDPEACSHWADYTGAEYIFYNSDERALKTVVRANPGLVMIKDGIILKKWSNWNFPTPEEVEAIVKANEKGIEE